MSIFTRTLIAAAVASAVAGPANAAMGEFQAGGKKFKIYDVQLGIAPAGGGCAPIEFKVNGWVFMSHPTTVEVMIVNGSGQVSGPYSITSVKSGNRYMATYSSQFTVNAPVKQKYRMVVGGGSAKGSPWVTVDVPC